MAAGQSAGRAAGRNENARPGVFVGALIGQARHVQTPAYRVSTSTQCIPCSNALLKDQGVR
jgi:hypothetical protein